MHHDLYVYIVADKITDASTEAFKQRLKKEDERLLAEWQAVDFLEEKRTAQRYIKNIRSEFALATWKSVLLKIVQNLDVDCYVLPAEKSVLRPSLLMSDMDSTMISIEVIDELAKKAGVGEQVITVTEEAMRGEIDFTQSLRKRVALLQGLSVNAIEEIKQSLPLSPGAEYLMGQTKKQQVKTALVSGGFLPFVEQLQRMLGFDFVKANRLSIDDDKLVGTVQGNVVDAQAKADFLGTLSSNIGGTSIAIGDGANDLLMLSRANLGVAYHAKPKVREQADISIVHGGLEVIAYHFDW